jgi:hypothetical protein
MYHQVFKIYLFIFISIGCSSKINHSYADASPSYPSTQELKMSKDLSHLGTPTSKWLIKGNAKIHIPSISDFKEKLTQHLQQANNRLAKSKDTKSKDTKSKDTKSKNAKSKEIKFAISEIIDQQYDRHSYKTKFNVKLRLNPSHVKPFLAWLHQQGKVIHERINRSEVSQKLQAYQIKLDNKKLTLKRLRTLLQQAQNNVKEVLAIEKEMMRVRELIEVDLGQLRWLSDQVQRATLHLTMIETKVRLASQVRKNAKFYLVGRPSLLLSEGQQQWGAGLSLVNPQSVASFRFDLDYFMPTETQNRGVIATLGGGVYSDFLGRGKRQFINPYLAIRTGYAYQDDHAVVVGAEVGLELFKSRYFFINGKAQGLALINKEIRAVSLIGFDLGLVY